MKTIVLATIVLLLPLRLAAGGAFDEQFLAALEQRDLVTAERLLEHGVDVNASDRHGKTALILAAREGNAHLVRRLLDAGADVNQTTDNGGTALMFAAIEGDLDTVRILVDADAEINAIGGFDWTAIMVAAVKGRVGVVRFLISRGGDANIPDIYGWTPLMRAVYEHRTGVVTTLLEWPRIALDVHNDQGATALHYAAERGYEDLVESLLARGADPGSEDGAGRTPLQVASARGHDRVARMLEASASE